MTSVERNIRARLGVPETATSVLILGMDAHMDWDWLNTFQELVNAGNGNGQGSVTTVITDAWNLMSANQGSTPYMYSVCEMGFLRTVLEANPDLLTQYTNDNLSQQLAIEGGGITSPDNLLPHGEAFIRNYLVGTAWQSATLGLTSTFAYMPDDFGHDAQLPVMIEAMGFQGVSFSRIPGSWASSQMDPLSGTSLWSQLMSQGADLFWQGSDGSSVLAHLEQQGYCQGNVLKNYCGNMSQAVNQIGNLLAQNQPSSPSPYVYLPCGCDFAIPIPCLLDMAAAWNAQSPAPTTYAVVGTLEMYMQAVLAWSGENPGKLVSRSMDPTPYWTGHYASRPANKILHQTTVRALLGAEVFGTIADLLQTSDALAWAPVTAARRTAIAQGWEAVLPSTHHDYINGTAVDSVYSEEQLPLLRAARSIAVGARRTTVQEIAPLIGAHPRSGEIPVAVFNQHGFAMNGLVEIPGRPGLSPSSVRYSDDTYGPVQQTSDGNLIFPASAPSFGYDTVYLTDNPVSYGEVTVTIGSDTVTMTNSLLTLQIRGSENWAIYVLQPIVNGVPQPDIIPGNDFANALTFYEDRGNLYNFGNESIPSGLTQVNGTTTPGGVELVESGPLRAVVRATVSFTDGTCSADYTLEYTLNAGEPFVRMAVTGSAPLPADTSRGGTPYAVMTRFPIAGSGGSVAVTDGVVRGTPYHWYDQLPTPYWQGPTFQATHNFVVPSSGGKVLCAIYHAAVPAWGIDNEGAMIGCILRNTPGVYPWPQSYEGRGANGVDFGVHTQRYALRVPQGLDLPSDGTAIFEESAGFATPLLGAYVNVPSAGVSGGNPVTVSFHETFSLASVVSGGAVLTVAKEGEYNPAAMILRLYHPTASASNPVSVTISLSDYITATGSSSPLVMPVNALEGPIDGVSALPVSNGTFTITMKRALATVAITPGT